MDGGPESGRIGCFALLFCTGPFVADCAWAVKEEGCGRLLKRDEVSTVRSFREGWLHIETSDIPVHCRWRRIVRRRAYVSFPASLT